MQFDKTQVIPLFPTFLWALDLPEAIAGPMNDRLEAAILRLLEPRPPILPGQTWQTHQDLHERPEFAELVRFIMIAGSRVLEFLRAEPDPLVITGCWANVNPNGSPHKTHTHPNNFLSGVYYIRTAKGADVIRFVDPRPQTLQIAPRFRERGPTNSYESFAAVPPGRLVVFPAWLAHSVPNNESGRDRISISFNLMFSNFADAIAKPRWEGIRASDERE